VRYFFKHFHLFKPLRISHFLQKWEAESTYSARRLANPLRGPPQTVHYSGSILYERQWKRDLEQVYKHPRVRLNWIYYAEDAWHVLQGLVFTLQSNYVTKQFFNKMHGSSHRSERLDVREPILSHMHLHWAYKWVKFENIQFDLI
jgi:hypothetical protein